MQIYIKELVLTFLNTALPTVREKEEKNSSSADGPLKIDE